jgi:glyoxylate reductase
MAKIFVTRNIPDAGIKLLKSKGHTVRISKQKGPISRVDLVKGVKWCDALLCLLTDKIDKKIINTNPNLKIIANYAVGYDNIDQDYAWSKGIAVSNTPSLEISNAVAEHTFALIMACLHHLTEADDFVRDKKYKFWDPNLYIGPKIKNKKLGIIGLGRIGARVAEIAYGGMGMEVVYYDIRRDKSFEKKYKAKFCTLTKLLKESDIVSLHVPLLKSTKHLISAKELKMMKKTSYLINTSRGPVIDEKALVSALQKKVIAGAGLDVYEFEPRLTPGLTKLRNVVLTPHIASASLEARQDMSRIAAKNIMAVLKGKKPITPAR